MTVIGFLVIKSYASWMFVAFSVNALSISVILSLLTAYRQHNRVCIQPNPVLLRYI